MATPLFRPDSPPPLAPAPPHAPAPAPANRAFFSGHDSDTDSQDDQDDLVIISEKPAATASSDSQAMTISDDSDDDAEAAVQQQLHQRPSKKGKGKESTWDTHYFGGQFGSLGRHLRVELTRRCSQTFSSKATLSAPRGPFASFHPTRKSSSTAPSPNLRRRARRRARRRIPSYASTMPRMWK